jgi:hypothetical protein
MSKLNPKLDLVETTTGTPVETGGKAPYFFSKNTGKLHFCALFILRCCPKTTVLGKGWGWFRLELYGAILGG